VRADVFAPRPAFQTIRLPSAFRISARPTFFVRIFGILATLLHVFYLPVCVISFSGKASGIRSQVHRGLSTLRRAANFDKRGAQSGSASSCQLAFKTATADSQSRQA
jgi:hypothetical protein